MQGFLYHPGDPLHIIAGIVRQAALPSPVGDQRHRLPGNTGLALHKNLCLRPSAVLKALQQHQVGILQGSFY